MEEELLVTNGDTEEPPTPRQLELELPTPRQLELVSVSYLKSIFRKFINSDILNFFSNVNENGDITLISDEWSRVCAKTSESEI